MKNGFYSKNFWKFWNDAERGVNGFVPIKVNYWEHPKRDKAWAEDQRKILGEIKFNQEVLCAFLGSSNTLIAADAIARINSAFYLLGRRAFLGKFSGNFSELTLSRCGLI